MPGLKAGLIGAGVAVLLSLLQLVPYVGCLALLLELALYVGVGVLAAYWVASPRDVGKGAGNGAVAGLLTGLGGGLTTLIATAVRLGVQGQSYFLRQYRQLPPGIRDQWRDRGLDPRLLVSPGLIIGSATLCCGLGLLVATSLAAAGGALGASLLREPAAPPEAEPEPEPEPEL